MTDDPREAALQAFVQETRDAHEGQHGGLSCNLCAMNDALTACEAKLAEVREALQRARIAPEGACTLCHVAFAERHEGSVMADDHGKHCHPSCWYKQKFVACEAKLADLQETIDLGNDPKFVDTVWAARLEACEAKLAEVKEELLEEGGRCYTFKGVVDDLQEKLEAAESQLRDAEEVLADKRRLTRELDVAMNGEEGAAPQASLCDLIGQAKQLRALALVVEKVRALPDGWLASADAASGTADPRLWARALGIRECIEQLRGVLSPVPSEPK